MFHGFWSPVCRYLAAHIRIPPRRLEVEEPIHQRRPLYPPPLSPLESAMCPPQLFRPLPRIPSLPQIINLMLDIILLVGGCPAYRCFLRVPCRSPGVMLVAVPADTEGAAPAGPEDAVPAPELAAFEEVVAFVEGFCTVAMGAPPGDTDMVILSVVCSSWTSVIRASRSACTVKQMSIWVLLGRYSSRDVQKTWWPKSTILAWTRVNPSGSCNRQSFSINPLVFPECTLPKLDQLPVLKCK